MAEEHEESGNNGSFILALGVGVGLTLLLEIAFTFGLDTSTSLVARYMSVMAGVIVTIIVAILGRGLIKSAFAGLLTLLSSAILPLTLGMTSLYGIITPLVPAVSETIKLLTDLNLLDATTQSGLEVYLQYAVGLDLVFGLLISTFAGIGMVMVLKIFKKNSGVLSIVGFVIGLVFLLVGALILPWLFVGISGTSNFVLGMSNGGLELQLGLSLVGNNMTSENAALAAPYFERANEWFAQSQKMLQELNNLGMFWMVSLAFPQYSNVINDGSVVLDAGTDLVQAIGPFVSAGALLSEGFAKAGTSFTGGTGGIALQQTDQDFNEGIDLIEASFENITQATVHIQNALKKISNLTPDDLKASLQEAGISGNDEQVDLVFDAMNVLNSTINVLKVLINPLDNSPRAPMIHLLFGIKALSSAGDIIGDQSNFANTGKLFDNVKTNLTIIDDALNTPTLLEFRSIDSTQYAPDIAQIHSTMAGAFNFFDDTADIAIGFADFGKSMVPILNTMNSTLGILNQENLDLLGIADSTFDLAISNLETMQAQSKSLVVTATDIQVNVDDMANKSRGDYYGLLQSAASDFSAQFTSFDLVTNSQNFEYLSAGFSEVFKAAKLLKATNVTVGLIQKDIKEIADASGNLILQNQTFFENAPNISANVAIADNLLANASMNIDYAKSNFTKAINDGGMTQLGNIDVILGSINTHITNLRGSQGIGKIKTIMDDPAAYLLSVGGDLSTVTTDLQTALDYIVTELDGITSDLSSLSIAA